MNKKPVSGAIIMRSTGLSAASDVDPHLVELVKFLARVAAEKDYYLAVEQHKKQASEWIQ